MLGFKIKYEALEFLRPWPMGLLALPQGWPCNHQITIIFIVLHGITLTDPSFSFI
jgi:hypothetical protein